MSTSLAGARRPFVMYIHGGALMGGSRKQVGNPMFAELSKLGYVIVSIDYRLAPETKTPGIIEDVQDAWRWMRTEGSKRFGIDPDRISTTGGSAGGYLTMMTGFCVEAAPALSGFVLRLWRYRRAVAFRAR